MAEWQRERETKRLRHREKHNYSETVIQRDRGTKRHRDNSKSNTKSKGNYLESNVLTQNNL